MNSDKDKEIRLLLAVALSIAVLVGYRFLFPAPEPPPVADNAAITATRAATAQTQDNVFGAMTTAAVHAGPARAATQAQARTIEVRTPLYTTRVTTAGGGITSFLLKEYKDVAGPKGQPLNLVGSDAVQPPILSLYTEENRPALSSPMIYRTDAPEVIEIAEGSDGGFVLSWESENGLRVMREYVFHGGRYDFDLRLQTTNTAKEGVAVRQGVNITQVFTGELAGDSYGFHGIAAYDSHGTTRNWVGMKIFTKRYTLKDISKGEVVKGPMRWASADSKYFTWVVIPEQQAPRENDDGQKQPGEWSLVRASLFEEKGVLFTMADAPVMLLSGESANNNVRVYAGPRQSGLLAAVGSDLESLIDYGWFSILAKPLVFLLKASNRITGNFGIDIILLTILIKILFFPLSQKQMSSMRKMQELAPMMSTIKEKYKGDTNRINQETMNLYKTYKVNPFSGCLPIMAQIPVFIALYRALLVTIDLRQAPFFLWITDLSVPEHLWNVDLMLFVLPIRLLPLLMGISMLAQQKMTPSASMDPMQQKMMLMMPVVFTFMFWGFPAGLVLYWLMNNLLSIGQQYLYNRKADAAKAATEAIVAAKESKE